ncbi:hypothetical protein ACH347_05645 [Saccharopolyspora sp. 5N102]|uniref:hypothetical protein n=1 Tax=Saccharopolyspora sp. 5N102 TaxID=3375155 RepID=UPI0037AC6BBE
MSEPTGMRPTEPMITGSATRIAWVNGASPSRWPMPGASGLSSAHAQKLIMKASVETASTTHFLADATANAAKAGAG